MDNTAYTFITAIDNNEFKKNYGTTMTIMNYEGATGGFPRDVISNLFASLVICFTASSSLILLKHSVSTLHR